MKLIPRIAPTFIFVGIFQLLSAVPAVAQLDLPDKPAKTEPGRGVDLEKRGRGNLAEEAATGKRTPDKTGLDVPRRKGPAVPPKASETPEGSSKALIQSIRGSRRLDSLEVRGVSNELVALGYEGLAAARAGLTDKDAAGFVVCLRALLDGGDGRDRKIILERLAKSIPGRSTAPVVQALVKGLAEPEALDLLVQLCDSRQGGLRRHAARELSGRELDMGRLLLLASSNRAEARELAYQAMVQLDRNAPGAAGVNDRLLDGLGDTNTRVAKAASEGLVGRIGRAQDLLVSQLVNKGRLGSQDDRVGAYALLTLIEAEDRLGVALIPAGEAVNLQMHLTVGSPFVRAISAAALAGIGFRSERSVTWLDRNVPLALVASVAGDTFFSEYTAVRPTLLRRLEMISGERLGNEGSLWRKWWADNGEGFHALRAVMPVTMEMYPSLELRWTDPQMAEGFRLLGPEANQGDVLFPGMTLRLSAGDSQVLMGKLFANGCFGADRMPGLVGVPSGIERILEVRVGRDSKAFRFGTGANSAWADEVIAEALRIKVAAAWQQYPGIQFGRDGTAAFVEAESAWWDSNGDPVLRSKRLANLIVQNMGLYTSLERGPGLAALRDLPEQALTLELFRPLTNLLEDEEFFGARAAGLLDLAIESGRIDGQPMDSDTAGRLMDLVFTKATTNRGTHLVKVLSAAEPAFQRSAALDPRSGVRSVAAAALAAGAREPADMALLRALLEDESDDVEAATVFAVSVAGIVEFREGVQTRARFADTEVRHAAIRGVGRMGGSGALEVLRLVVLDKELSVKMAGAEGLADLASPASTTLLTQMLATGEQGPFFRAAERGLMAIGEPAWDGLLVLARTETSPAKRPAMLMLARQEVSEVTTILLTTLTEDASDSVVARELAIMSGMDFRDSKQPANNWWVWHDQVRGEDSAAWFARAYNSLVAQGQDLQLASGGLRLDGAELRGQGTLAGALSLVKLLRVGAPGHMTSRAVRDLKRMVGQEIGSLPPKGRMRSEWCDVLDAKLPSVFAQRPVVDLGTEAAE